MTYEKPILEKFGTFRELTQWWSWGGTSLWKSWFRSLYEYKYTRYHSGGGTNGGGSTPTSS